MLFHSIDFAIFLPIVFIVYWYVIGNSLKAQNLFLVLASLLFYGWWDSRFLSLLLFSTVIDYGIGLLMGRCTTQRMRQFLLCVSLTVNLGVLAFFKYCNFFISSFNDAFSLFGQELRIDSLNIILPVGISFYTFQTLSYTIDVYRRKLEPTRDLIAFAAFVSFFPQLVAGPIERATHLLPQFYSKRTFDYHLAADGMRQILWGLFKKMVIADNCAAHANTIFDGYTEFSGSTLLLGAFFFSVQIYCDFSGYSDIAVGTSRLFGFDLMQNFAFPYFSRDVAEFWRRWHISLSTWFRDYIYIPMGGNRGKLYYRIRNTLVVFLLSGLWHGANWTFIAWGALNALYFLPLLIRNKNRLHLDTVAHGRLLPSLRELLSIASTFSMVLLAWIFFRATSLQQAISMLGNIFSSSLFTVPRFPGERKEITLVMIGVLFLVEWIGREEKHAIEKIGLAWSRPARWCVYYALMFTIVLLAGQDQQFIYFQF